MGRWCPQGYAPLVQGPHSRARAHSIGCPVFLFVIFKELRHSLWLSSLPPLHLHHQGRKRRIIVWANIITVSITPTADWATSIWGVGRERWPWKQLALFARRHPHTHCKNRLLPRETRVAAHMHTCTLQCYHLRLASGSNILLSESSRYWFLFVFLSPHHKQDSL